MVRKYLDCQVSSVTKIVFGTLLGTLVRGSDDDYKKYYHSVGNWATETDCKLVSSTQYNQHQVRLSFHLRWIQIQTYPLYLNESDATVDIPAHTT